MKISWRSPKGRINRKSYFLRNLALGFLGTLLVILFLVAHSFVFLKYTEYGIEAIKGHSFNGMLLLLAIPLGIQQKIGSLIFVDAVFLIPFIYVCFWLPLVNAIKRLHDLNLSGWFVLFIYFSSLPKEFSMKYPIIAVILGIIGFILSMFLLFKKGTEGRNNYGVDPLGEESEDDLITSQMDSNHVSDNFNMEGPLNSADSSFDSPDTMYRSAQLSPQQTSSSTSEDKLLGVLLKVMVGLIVAVVVVLGISHYIKSNQPSYKEVVYKNSDIKVRYLTGDMLQFLKENYPQDDKRLVIYIPELADIKCPRWQDFVRNLNQVKSDSKWEASYHFVPYVNSFTAESRSAAEEKMNKVQEFMEKICGTMCIVDTHENWVFEIKRGDLIPIALEEFKK